MLKTRNVILTMIALLVLVAGLSQRHAIACEALPVLSYEQLDDEVFLARGVTASQVQIVSELIADASARITDAYGPPLSTPRFLITSDKQSAALWGANETAAMHRAPWGSCVVIGPKGQNVDVIAHESLHAEIQHRVGYFRLLREIPVWFDEGAALTVDYREPFLPENIKLSEEEVTAVKDLKTGGRFFSNDIRKNYQASRIAVDPLIHPERFFDDLERIAAGESFASVF